MNLVKNKTLHPHLRDEEIIVVENAIRLAIDSIINVLYGVNSARTHEYQRMVADRDKEIQRLECRLKDIEHQLQAPHRQGQGCTSGMLEEATGSHRFIGAQSPGGPQQPEQDGFEPGCADRETTAGQHECEMSISLGLFARPPSQVSSNSHESAVPSSPSRMGLDQSYTSHSSESSGVSEAARNLPTSPSSLVVKEEPCDMDTVFIKWEMSEEGFREHPESTSSPCQNKESPSEKGKLEDRGGRRIVEKAHADPDGHRITEGEHLRNKKKSVPMSELTEEAQRLKRAAWRAASRRYYARKIARQQANPPCPGPLPHITDSQYSQPISAVNKRRRTLISELPDESQTLQREAWRAASRRYYARKTSHHQTESAQYAHLLQNTEPSEETLGPNSGGIMCS
uniref:uncharacterized protein LOC124064382 n=1 Tax=Scatophagus argus TaxID=75038 RepID=UPI001ED7DF74|nr:uncharacterized protein LOC124064382 [Scatophagus argus]XP_046254753.1 uncharacterized protein LOC124064382 [Scatophagus argus]